MYSTSIVLLEMKYNKAIFTSMGLCVGFSIHAQELYQTVLQVIWL